MTFELAGRPCRNFNILAVTVINDPLDDREKVVLSNFASGSTGAVILLDPADGTAEAIELPGDEGGWALLSLDERTLLVGTCAQHGFLHRLDLVTRRWMEPLSDPAETYIWNLARGSDGFVYGGTWPGGMLLRYDPKEHRLDSLGKVSDNRANQYTRMVWGDAPGRLVITCGWAEPHLAVWDLASGRAQRFGRPGAQVKEVNERFICTELAGELEFHDARTLELLAGDAAAALERELTPAPQPAVGGTRDAVRLSDGRVFAVRGQEYFVCDPAVGRASAPPIDLRPIPTERPPTSIMTIAADAEGRIWGSSAFGQTIFRYDPRTGESWNSSAVADSGGEVYGMVWSGDRLFMSCYAGGDHVVYDPAASWNQVENLNPRTLQCPLEPNRPALIRPSGRSVTGSDGAIWTGWMAEYGSYGCGLSRVAPHTLSVRIWRDQVPGQAIVGLSADRRFLYAVTAPMGNGLPRKQEPSWLVVVTAAGEVVVREELGRTDAVPVVCAAEGLVLVSVGHVLRCFDPASMRFTGELALDAPCETMIAEGAGVALFSGGALYRVDPRGLAVRRLCDAPAGVRWACLTPDGSLYCAAEMDLWRLRGERSDPAYRGG